MTEHVHLTDDALDEAAAAHLAGGDLPDCEACATEVSDLARYMMTARASAGQRAEPAGAPGVLAIRELRRSTYTRRALQQIARLIVPRPRGAQS